MMGNKYTYPPGPPQRPITGNMHNMDVTAMHTSLFDHKETYGPLSHFMFVGQNFISVNTMDAIREIFITSDDAKLMMDRPHIFLATYLFEENIATRMFSEEWLHLRCVAYKALTSTIQNVESVTSAQIEEFSELKSAIREKGDSVFDPRDVLDRSSVNMALVIMLTGRRLDYDQELFQLFKEYTCHSAALFTSGARLTLGIMPWLRKLPFGYGSVYGQLLQTTEKIMKFFLYDNQNDDGNGAVIQQLLKELETGKITQRSIEGFIHDTYNAGVQPVRSSLFALFYEILFHPDVQNKVHDEIVQVIGKTATPNAKDQDRMPYAEAVVLESLRLTSTVPGSVPRCNTEDITIQGYHLPKGTVFSPNVWRVHHDETLWEDPWSFKPERFLGEQGEALPKNHTKIENMIAFGVGKRSCLGKTNAISWLFLYLVNVIQSFEIYNDTLDLATLVDPRGFTRDTVMYPPVYEVQARERK